MDAYFQGTKFRTHVSWHGSGGGTNKPFAMYRIPSLIHRKNGYIRLSNSSKALLQRNVRKRRGSAVAPCASLTTDGAIVVGWIVVAGSCVRSLPQILRITKNKGVQGLSLTSFVSELGAFMITIAYNVRFLYPLSTWGDTLTNAIQHAILVGMIFFYNKDIRNYSKVAIISSYCLGTYLLFSNICTDDMLRWLQSMVIVILTVFGRLPQVVLNFRRGNSGELSFGSTALSVAGNLARVFTTWALVKDPIIMATAMSQLVLNSILLAQILDTIRQQEGTISYYT
jgi:mannose-P-dolichol utilization defect protein 1